MTSQQESNAPKVFQKEEANTNELTQRQQFQKKYNYDFMTCLSSDVSKMGYNEVANEILDIIGQPDDDMPQKIVKIPSFEDNKISLNDDNPYYEYFHKKMAESYKKKVISNDVFAKIKEALHYPILRKETRSKIDFNKLSEQLPGFEYLFSPKILNRSEMTSKYDFMSYNYCEFVRKCQNIQNALLCMIEVIPHFSTQFIIQEDFEKFIDTYRTKIHALESQKSSSLYEKFRPYYSRIVSTYFSFFISNCLRDRFETKSLVFSEMFQQFIDMDNMERQNNPFTTAKTMPIYNSFLKNDKNKTGKLSMEQIKNFEGYIFIDAFLERLFEVLQLLDSEIDFAEYTRFYIALNNIKTPQGTKYFFQVFDLNGDGKIDQSDINFFYKEILKEYSKNTQNTKYTGSFDTFLSQLYDIINCQSHYITEEVLITSNNQDVFFKILFDVNTFIKWETDNQVEEEEDNIIEGSQL